MNLVVNLVRETKLFLQARLTQYLAYLYSLIFPERQISYDLCNPQAYAQYRARIDHFSNPYFHNTLHEWNKPEQTEICIS